MSQNQRFNLIKLTTVPDKIKDLVHGYMRMSEISLWKNNSDAYYKIPLSIQHICLTFYFIHMKFDVYTESDNDCNINPVQNNGTIFIGQCDETGYGAVNAGCSIAHNDGISKYKLQIKQLEEFAFGITSNINNAKGNAFFYEYDDWSVYVCFDENGAWPWFSYKTNDGEKAFEDYKVGIKNSDYVTMELDCNEWRLSYYVNSTFIGECEIEPNLKYYVCVSTQLFSNETFECQIIDT
eukprot:207216_1